MRDELDAARLYAACASTEPAERRDGYRRLGTFLARVVRARAAGQADALPLAEDCAQDALVAIWRKIEDGHGPDDPARFLAWSAAIAIHKLYDALRRKGYTSGPAPAAGEPEHGGTPEGAGAVETSRVRVTAAAPSIRLKRVPPAWQTSLDALLEGAGDAAGGPLDLPDPSADHPETETVARAGFARLVLAIGDHPQLSDDSRQILVRGFLADATDAELADRLGVSRSNVQVIRSRNLTKLRHDDDLVARLRAWYAA